MSLIARLGVVLGIDISEFTKGLDTATNKTKEFEYNQRKQLRIAEQATSAMAANLSKAALGAVGFGYALSSAFAKADEIMDVAVAFDMTVDSLLATKGALQASGGEAENLTTLMSKLASIQEEARNGSDSMRESFEKLNISGRDVDNLKLDELFKLVAVELAKVEDAGKRAAIAQDLLGKAAKGVNWSDFVANYKEFANPELSRAIEDNAKAWDNIEKSMKSISMLVQQLVQPFAIVFNYAFDLLNIWKEIKQGSDAEIDWGAAMGGMPGDAGSTTFHAGTGKGKASPISIVGKPGAYSQLSEKQKAEAAKKAKEAEALEEKIVALIQKQQEKLSKFNAEMRALQSNQNQKEASYWQEYYLTLDLLDLESRRYKISENQYNSEKLTIEQKQKLIDINKRATDAEVAARVEMERASSDDAEYARQLYEQKIKNINDLRSLELASAMEFNEIERRTFEDSVERQYSWIEGWKAAFKTYSEESEKAFNRGQQAFSVFTSSMEVALRNFVETGKFNFKDFIGSVVKQILVAEAAAKASSLFRSFFSSIGSVLVGGLTKDAGAMEAFSKQQYPGRASGGAITGASLVGENGPELFIPRTPGTIIPNGSWQQMATGGGGLTVNGPYIASLSAIDTQSATQFLASNKNTIWAAYQSANRGVPISR